MKSFVRIFVWLFLLPFALPMKAVPVRIPELIAMLKDSESSVRIAAFYEMLQPAPPFRGNAKERTLILLRDHSEDREAVAQALIDLLARENSIINRAASGSLPESYGDYHASLIWSVATLRDARAVDALLGAIKTGGLASNGLVALGVAAIPALVVAVESPDPHVRVGATMALGEMALQRGSLGLDTASTDVIRSGLLRAAEDKDDGVRWAAMLSLEPFVDQGVRDAMHRAATSDPSKRLREAATEWLRRHSSE